MKIEKWLSNPMSAISGVAIIRLEPNEIADAEAMLSLVDKAIGFFGYTIELVSTTTSPSLVKKSYGWDVKTQFGFEHMPKLKTMVRFYKVFVNRD